ncbi:MAG: hypothetical protein MUE73_18555 [Planctomycetes bacterium]|jgi:hypothetical protein|nr:hypothetical protein [Planctomycetota bacterium]
MVRSAVPFLLAGLVLTSCSTPRPAAVDVPERATRLPGISIGQTTRADLLLRYGMPTGRFENDRILTFMLRLTADDELLPVSGDVAWRDPRFRTWDFATYSLVTVFEPDGRLARFELVRVNG